MKSSNSHEDSQVDESVLEYGLDYTGLSVGEAVSLLARWTSAEQARLNQFYDYDTVTAAINAERHRRSGITVPRPAEDPATRYAKRRIALERAWHTDPAPIDYTLPGFKIGTVGVLGGVGGTSKSFLAMQSAVSIGIGRDAFGVWDGAEIRRGRVVFLSLEDDEDSLLHRIREIAKSGKVSAEEEALAFENVDVISLYGCGFRIAEPAENGKIVAGEWVEGLAEYAAGARLIVVDTMSRAVAGLDENSAAVMSAVMSTLEEVAKESGAAVLIVHHLNKEGIFKGDDESLDQSVLRGSSLIVDNARWLALLATMNENIAERRYGADAEQHVRRWTKRMHPKQNYGAPVSSQWLRRVDGGLLDGGEQVQEVPAAGAAGGDDDGDDGRRRAFRARNGGGR